MNRLNQQNEEFEEEQTSQDELDDMLDDLVTRDDDKKKKPEGGEPGEPEGDDTEPEGEEHDELEEPEEEPEGDEEEGEEPEEEPDDDLMEYSKKGLLKLIENEKFEIELDDDASESDIRRAIRDAREAVENDPDRRMAEMRDWMNEQAKSMMAGQQLEGQQQKAGQQGETSEGQQPQVPQVPPMGDMPKMEVTDEMYEEALRDKDGFTKYTNDLLQVGEQRAMQRVMPMVNQLVQQQFALHTIVNDFYSDNPDLRPYREFVSFLASQIGSKNPDKSYPEILGIVESEARKRLRLAKAEAAEESDNKPTKKAKPSFAGDKAKGNRRGRKTQKPSKEEQEFSDMIDNDLDDPFAGRI